MQYCLSVRRWSLRPAAALKCRPCASDRPVGVFSRAYRIARQPLAGSRRVDAANLLASGVDEPAINERFKLQRRGRRYHHGSPRFAYLPPVEVNEQLVMPL